MLSGSVIKKIKKKIVIVGAGWAGCYIAYALQVMGYDVTLLEAGPDICSDVSGKFGLRLHAGPHYPSSSETRENCRYEALKFEELLPPEFLVKLAYSIYGYATSDADNKPSKVDFETFKKVVFESKNAREVDPEIFGYTNLEGVFAVEEPFMVIGNLLRKRLRALLDKTGVKVVTNFEVQQLKRKNGKTFVYGKGGSYEAFDYAVNATGFKQLLPSSEHPLPCGLKIAHQICLALRYKDQLAEQFPPSAFIVMDGWHPCIMPYISGEEEIDEEGKKHTKYTVEYIVTHGKYTNIATYDTPEEANKYFELIDEKFIEEHVRPQCEAEMQKYWPAFGACLSDGTKRFVYEGVEGVILTKQKTPKEHRSYGLVAKNGIAYAIPGKVGGVIPLVDELVKLIEEEKEEILEEGPYKYVKGGTLHKAAGELSAPIEDATRVTGCLQTFAHILKDLERAKEQEKEKEKEEKYAKIQEEGNMNIEGSNVPQNYFGSLWNNNKQKSQSPKLTSSSKFFKSIADLFQLHHKTDEKDEKEMLIHKKNQDNERMTFKRVFG